jgi:pilus assembly protein CpaC
VLFGFNAGGLEVGILLEALESKGVVRTLAEPNLTALSGQEASFLAGGEYPVPIVDGDGGVGVDRSGIITGDDCRVMDNSFHISLAR